MSAEPNGTHQRGKPIPAETIQRLKRLYEHARNIREACRAAGVTRRTGKKYLGLTPLPELDI